MYTYHIYLLERFNFGFDRPQLTIMNYHRLNKKTLAVKKKKLKNVAIFIS